MFSLSFPSRPSGLSAFPEGGGKFKFHADFKINKNLLTTGNSHSPPVISPRVYFLTLRYFSRWRIFSQAGARRRRALAALVNWQNFIKYKKSRQRVREEWLSHHRRRCLISALSSFSSFVCLENLQRRARQAQQSKILKILKKNAMEEKQKRRDLLFSRRALLFFDEKKVFHRRAAVAHWRRWAKQKSNRKTFIQNHLLRPALQLWHRQAVNERVCRDFVSRRSLCLISHLFLLWRSHSRGSRAEQILIEKQKLARLRESFAVYRESYLFSISLNFLVAQVFHRRRARALRHWRLEANIGIFNTLFRRGKCLSQWHEIASRQCVIRDLSVISSGFRVAKARRRVVEAWKLRMAEAKNLTSLKEKAARLRRSLLQRTVFSAFLQHCRSVFSSRESYIAALQRNFLLRPAWEIMKTRHFQLAQRHRHQQRAVRTWRIFQLRSKRERLAALSIEAEAAVGRVNAAFQVWKILGQKRRSLKQRAIEQWTIETEFHRMAQNFQSAAKQRRVREAVEVWRYRAENAAAGQKVQKRRNLRLLRSTYESWQLALLRSLRRAAFHRRLRASMNRADKRSVISRWLAHRDESLKVQALGRFADGHNHSKLLAASFDVWRSEFSLQLDFNRIEEKFQSRAADMKRDAAIRHWLDFNRISRSDRRLNELADVNFQFVGKKCGVRAIFNNCAFIEMQRRSNTFLAKATIRKWRESVEILQSQRFSKVQARSQANFHWAARLVKNSWKIWRTRAVCAEELRNFEIRHKRRQKKILFSSWCSALEFSQSSDKKISHFLLSHSLKRFRANLRRRRFERRERLADRLEGLERRRKFAFRHWWAFAVKNHWRIVKVGREIIEAKQKIHQIEQKRSAVQLWRHQLPEIRAFIDIQTERFAAANDFDWRHLAFAAFRGWQEKFQQRRARRKQWIIISRKAKLRAWKQQTKTETLAIRGKLADSTVLNARGRFFSSVRATLEPRRLLVLLFREWRHCAHASSSSFKAFKHATAVAERRVFLAWRASARNRFSRTVRRADQMEEKGEKTNEPTMQKIHSILIPAYLFMRRGTFAAQFQRADAALAQELQFDSLGIRAHKLFLVKKILAGWRKALQNRKTSKSQAAGKPLIGAKKIVTK